MPILDVGIMAPLPLIDDLYRALPDLSGESRRYLWSLYPILFLAFSSVWTACILIAAKLLIKAPSDMPWQERARVTYPPRVIAGMFANMILITALIIASLGYLEEYPMPRWLFVSLCGGAAYSGVALVSPFLHRWAGVERIPAVELLRMNGATFGIFLLFYFVGSWCYVTFSPYGAPAGAIAAFLAVVILTKFGAQLGIMWLCGMVRRPSERLRRMAEEAARESNLGFKLRVFEMRTPHANAFAFPGLRLVGVTTRALQYFDDRELKGVLHHEFGHLTESVLQRGSRFLPLLIYSLFLGLWPVISRGWNQLLFLPSVVLVAFGVRMIGSRISRRLEERADAHAHTASAGDEAIYAGALEKIYAANLTPAVLRAKTVTHPDLYDRMSKAGVAPSYLRPKPPSRLFTVVGTVLTVVVAIGFVVVLQLVQYKATQGSRNSTTSAAVGAHDSTRRTGHLN